MSATSVRPARPSDAGEIALLINIATHGLTGQIWAGDKDAESTYSPLEIGRLKVLSDVGSASWRKATVAENAGEVVGLLLGGVDPDARPQKSPDMPSYAVPFAELTSLAPGAWYISMLAVHLRWRGQGIGARLLQEADLLRSTTGARGLSLVVEDANSNARAVYERHGYGIRGRTPVVPFPGGGPPAREWLLMVKE